LTNKLIKVQTHSSEKLLDELIALAGDPSGLRDVGANFGLHDADAIPGFLPLLHLGQVELQEVPQLVGHDPCTAHNSVAIRGVSGGRRAEGTDTFGDGVALVERVDGGGEGGEADKLGGLAEALEVNHGGPDGVEALPNLVDSVRVEQSVPRRRLE
jgi:hypothetical protein